MGIKGLQKPKGICVHILPSVKDFSGSQEAIHGILKDQRNIAVRVVLYKQLYKVPAFKKVAAHASGMFFQISNVIERGWSILKPLHKIIFNFKKNIMRRLIMPVEGCTVDFGNLAQLLHADLMDRLFLQEFH